MNIQKLSIKLTVVVGIQHCQQFQSLLLVASTLGFLELYFKNIFYEILNSIP